MVALSEKDSQVDLPDGWEYLYVGDHFDFKNGLNKAKKYFGYGTPIINYMDVYKWSGIAQSKIEGKVDVTADEKRAYSVRKCDVFFTRTSETPEEIGIASVLVEDIDSGVFSGFVLRARPKTVAFNIDFKKYCFSSYSVRKQIQSTSSYTTRALTNGRLLSQVAIPAPIDTKEQESIANALTDTDALIEDLEALIAKKRDIKTATMQQLLSGQARLPGFSSDAAYQETELGAIPSDWKIMPLGKLATMKSGEGITSANINNFSGFPCYGGNGLRGYTERYTHDGNYILIGRVGALCGNILVVNGTFFASEHAIVCAPETETDLNWLAFSLGRLQLNKMSEASAQPVLTVGKLNKIKIITPSSKREQFAISQVISDIEREISSYISRLVKLSLVKQGMMQELLTGRTRLI